VELFTGFKSALKAELDALLPPDTRVVTEDGSVGEKGFVSDYVKSENYCALVSCGPEALLKALGRRAGETPCFVSLESRMACGMGACMGCTIETKQGNKRCCKDSQIYDIRELPWD
jgi:dihydroorotate dehydrogenase electron transfer subunit